MELGDNILGRALGSPQAVPEGRVQPWHPRFVDRGSLGRRPPPGLGHHGISLDLTGTDLRQRARYLREGQIDLPGYQILDHRRAAAVGHELEAGARALLKVSSQDIRSAADARNSHSPL